MWLCNNHHKLFDINYIYISEEGKLKYKTNIEQIQEEYVRDFTMNSSLPNEILTSNFITYLTKRNSLLNEEEYTFV